MARLFFALWPDAQVAGALARHADAAAAAAFGRAVPASKLHLTLAFLGEVDEAAGRQARAAGAAVRAAPLELRFDTLGSFPQARVAWIGPSSRNADLIALHGALAAELAARGFAWEARPYVPHVTIARRISGRIPNRPVEPIRWRSDELTLVRSASGTGSYEIVDRWALV